MVIFHSYVNVYQRVNPKNNAEFMGCSMIWLMVFSSSTWCKELHVYLQFMVTISGWWFGTFCLFFHFFGFILTPTDELIFFRGVGLNHQPDMVTIKFMLQTIQPTQNWESVISPRGSWTEITGSGQRSENVWLIRLGSDDVGSTFEKLILANSQ